MPSSSDWLYPTRPHATAEGHGEPRDTNALAVAIAACLGERTTVIREEMRRIAE
jgi:hypothetical protein